MVDWITIGSLTLNIVGLMVFLKVPEFVQSFFIKRIDHNFNERMNEIQYEQEKDLNRIQSEFHKERQKMEHEFQVNLDTMKKKKEILPELYENIIVAYTHYVHSTDDDRNNKKEFARNGLIHLAKVRNFLTLNKFFINQPIYNKAKEFDELSKELAVIEHSEYQSVRDDISQMTTEDLEIERKEIHKQLTENIEELEKMIREDLNS